MSFDDSTSGQATRAIPLLNKLRLVGTFFVNPGLDHYNNYKTIWEHDSQLTGGGCQELANHTMHHDGASNEEEARKEIYDAAKIIWKARGQNEKESLIAFNKGGGTTWGSIDLGQIMADYTHINRCENYLGQGYNGQGAMIETQVLPATESEDILRNLDSAKSKRMILYLSFHGIAADTQPIIDGKIYEKGTKNGSVHEKEFKSAMEILAADDEIWSAGYTQLHQYIWETYMAETSVEEISDIEYLLNITLDKSKNICSKNNAIADEDNNPVKDFKYYKEPLTFLFTVPKTWENCSITQNGNNLNYYLKEGKLQFDAIPSPINDYPITIKATKVKGDSGTSNGNTVPNTIADYYVSLLGDDSNTGLVGSPLKSIANAVKKLDGIGGTVLVEDGVYDQYIDIKVSGLAEKPIIIKAKNKGKSKVIGFRVLQNSGKNQKNIVIDGFEVEADASKEIGIMNYGGENISILNCNIHDCPKGGISGLKKPDKMKISNNIIDHNGGSGIYLDGTNSIIEYNTISNTTQRHPKLDPYPGYMDSDGIVIYNEGHTIRYNKIIDIGSNELENPAIYKDVPSNMYGPHSDGIQSTSNSNVMVINNSEIYGNHIRVRHISGKGIMLEPTSEKKCTNLIFANNIVEFNDGGFVNERPNTLESITIANNLFKGTYRLSGGSSVVLLNKSTNYKFINNICLDFKDQREIIPGTGEADYNLFYNSYSEEGGVTRLGYSGGGSVSSAKSENDIVKTDPKLVNYSTYGFGSNDYHPQSESPVIGKGIPLSGTEALTKNIEGISRIDSWNIGPY